MRFKLSSNGQWHDDQDPRCLHFKGDKHSWLERLWAGMRCDTCRKKKLKLPFAINFQVGHMIVINGELYRFVQYGTSAYPDAYGVRTKEILLRSISKPERKAMDLE